MSKERARRRAEREAAAAVERARRQRVLERRRRRQALGSALARPFVALRRGNRPVDSALARHRRRQNGVLLAVVVSAHAAFWLLEPSWTWRITALALTVGFWPIILVVLFDRRSTR